MRRDLLLSMSIGALKGLDHIQEKPKILPLRFIPDPILETPAEPIEQFDDPSEQHMPLTQMASMMELTRQHYKGAGLAAPQVGFAIRMCIVAVEGVRVVMCNPRLEHQSGNQRCKEGCLSIPGYELIRDRFENTTVKFQDVLGRESFLEAKGYLAQVIQHEVEHLSGVLFIDPFGRNVRRAAIRSTNRYRRLSGEQR